MADITFASLAEEYAQKIKATVKRTSLTKTAMFLTEATQYQVFNELKEISEDIKKYSQGGKELTDDQLKIIFKIVGEKLGLKEPGKVYLMIKEASNDNFVALANYWATFYEEIVL